MDNRDSDDKQEAGKGANKGKLISNAMNSDFPNNMAHSDSNGDASMNSVDNTQEAAEPKEVKRTEGRVAALRELFKRPGGKVKSETQNIKPVNGSKVSDSITDPSRADQRARAKFLADKFEKIIATNKSVDTTANSALQPSTHTPSITTQEDIPDVTSDVKPLTSIPTIPKLPTTSIPSPPSSGPRIHTLSDTLSTDVKNDKVSQLLQDSASDETTQASDSTAAQRRSRNIPSLCRRRCLIRISVTEKIFPGKLILSISTTTLILVLFLYELYINKTTFNGRCVGEVDYSNRVEDKAIISYLGYVACESNLKMTAAERGMIGAAASDKGYPEDVVHDGRLGMSPSLSDGPNYRIAQIMGAITANKVRIYGESFRLLTSIFLHGGWNHLLGNMLVNMALLYIIEPDWGFLRTLALYLFGGYSANLVHASMSPCISGWGASGSLFALFGALIPYTVEHWDNLRRPSYVVIVPIILFLAELMNPIKGTSHHAHLGGFIFGLCFGFSTLKSVAAFDRGAIYSRFMLLFERWLSPESVETHKEQVVKSARAEDIARIKYEQTAKDNMDRYQSIKKRFGIYPFGPYRMRLRDIITRATFFCITFALFMYFSLATFNEGIYSKLSSETSWFFSRNCFCGYLKSKDDDIIKTAQIGSLAGKFYCFVTQGERDKYC
ncbi:hypothetical protein protease ROM4 [Babesia ovis]|uniref:Rhomboid-like protease n=1 Tax=Babesia ovis TaxID=5869 RepID=A0A9W5WW09_BABOV|nr:hypothetical protein protease ROM4 [Babesia ovis]